MSRAGVRFQGSSDAPLVSSRASPHSHGQKHTPQSDLFYIHLQTVWFKVMSLCVFFWRPLEQLCNKCRNSGASLHLLWYSCWVISCWSTCWQTGDTDVNVYCIHPLFCTLTMTSLFLDLLTFQCRKWLHDINFCEFWALFLSEETYVYDLSHANSLLLYSQMFSDTPKKGVCRSFSSGSNMISLMTCYKLCSLGGFVFL